MKPNIDHLNRYVSNVNRFIEFYREVLGYELIGKGEKKNGMSFAILKGVDHELFISERQDFKIEGENFRHIGYSVDDVDNVLEKLKSRGMIDKTAEVVVKPYSRQVYLRDPDGFEIDLIQWIDKEGFYKDLRVDKPTSK